jgi:hypothetical protein
MSPSRERRRAAAASELRDERRRQLDDVRLASVSA